MQRRKVARSIFCAAVAAVLSLGVVGCNEEDVVGVSANEQPYGEHGADSHDVGDTDGANVPPHGGSREVYDTYVPPTPVIGSQDSATCPNGLRRDSATGVCVDECPQYAWWDERVNMCVRYSPDILCIDVWPAPLECLEDINGNMLARSYIPPPPCAPNEYVDYVTRQCVPFAAVARVNPQLIGIWQVVSYNDCDGGELVDISNGMVYEFTENGVKVYRHNGSLFAEHVGVYTEDELPHTPNGYLYSSDGAVLFSYFLNENSLRIWETTSPSNAIRVSTYPWEKQVGH